MPGRPPFPAPVVAAMGCCVVLGGILEVVPRLGGESAALALRNHAMELRLQNKIRACGCRKQGSCEISGPVADLG